MEREPGEAPQPITVCPPTTQPPIPGGAVSFRSPEDRVLIKSLTRPESALIKTPGVEVRVPGE